MVAEGALIRGDVSRASALVARGADRAEALGDAEQAAALRLRAGAILFQAQRFVEADPFFNRIANDKSAGALRAKAGLLRALGRGRALALGQAGASQALYLSALEWQVQNFPSDPSASEARWLLGKVRLASADRDSAQELWSAIARGDARWLEARLAVAGMRQDDLDTQRINNDRPLVLKRYEDARRFLEETRANCRSATERAAVELATARLELTPEVGNPEAAQHTCETILRSASPAEQRDQARRLHLVAMAMLNHFLAAEQEARAEIARSGPVELLETARLLDMFASESSSDLRMRRFGLIIRVLLARVAAREQELSAAERVEVRFRLTRALLLSGDDERGRSSVAAWSASPPTSSDRLLKDLADTYVRLEAFDLAADVERLRFQRLANGSLPWFEARYGLALAYYRSGKENEARKLIDATAILHPDLGGGELRTRFIRLRQRLNPTE
jgi:hypothetical protein